MKPPVFTTMADVGRRQRLGLTDLLLMVYSIGANEHLPPDWGHVSIHVVISFYDLSNQPTHVNMCCQRKVFVICSASLPTWPGYFAQRYFHGMQGPCWSMSFVRPFSDLSQTHGNTSNTPWLGRSSQALVMKTPCQVTQLGWRHHPKQRSWCRPPWLCKRSMLGDRTNPWVQNLRTKTIQKRPEGQLV